MASLPPPAGLPWGNGHLTRFADPATGGAEGAAPEDIGRRCRERIGLAPSGIATRVALVRRLTRLPAVEAALIEVRIGYAAAALIARVSGAMTEAAWVARAEHLTVKLLREELDARPSIGPGRLCRGRAARTAGRGDAGRHARAACLTLALVVA